MNFLERALPLIKRGIHVFPLEPRGKLPLTTHGVKDASNSKKQIEEWHALYPDANVGCAPNGKCYLDDDRGDLLERYEADTGLKFPAQTFSALTSVKETGLRGRHYYFDSTVESMVLGNRIERKDGKEIFSFRADDYYIVGAGSIHPDGHVYEPVDPRAAIRSIPLPLVEWIERNGSASKAARATKADGPIAHEDLDSDAWMNHYEDAFTCHLDGDWWVSSICPATYEGPGTGHKHEHSTKTGFRFDGRTPEFHCFAGGCPGSEMSFGDVVRHLNKYHEKYAGKIWQEEPIEEILRAFNVDTEPEAQPFSAIAAAEERSDEAGKNEAEKHVLVGKLEDDNIYVAVTNMGRVVPNPLEWMWDQRLLRYHLNLFAGKPEKCKTLAALEMAAILTTGRDWPDGRKNELGPRTVLIMMSEDGLEDVIWGRLTAAGADLNRVEAIKGVIIGEEMRKKKKKRLMALKNDTAALRSLVRKYPDAAMIIIDPISSYYGCNANKVEEVKPVLDSLKELCEESRIAILAVAHTNKRSDVDALQQVSGDTSVGGSFRSGWTFTDDPDKEDEYLMSNNKGNHAKDKSGLRLRPVGVSVRFPDNTEHDYPRVEWLGKTNLRAQDVQDKQKDNAKNGNSGRKIDAAKSLLLMKFAQSPQHKCTELYEEAKKEGISADTMKRARIQLLESRELVIDVDDRRASKDGFWWILHRAEAKFDIDPQEVM